MWDPRIVTNIPQKLHSIPADVLPSDSEDLLILRNSEKVEFLESNCKSPENILTVSFENIDF